MFDSNDQNMTEYQKEILKYTKLIYINSRKEYVKILGEYRKDPYNYNIKIKHQKFKTFVKNLLNVNNIHINYFFRKSYLIPSDVELNDINLMAEKLWSLDRSKFISNKDYRLNLQNRIDIHSKSDEAPYPLFDYVNESKFKIPTYKYFIRVLKLFSRDLGVKEEHSEYKSQQINNFISSLCDTNVFIYLYYFLRSKNIIDNFIDFPMYIYNLWFKNYSKITEDDSCTFEHIFIGEINAGKVYGFHNWIQFYNEEKIGKINYFGYVSKIKDVYPYIINAKFTWDNNYKMGSTIMIGTSIEFEIALYTICSILSENNKQINIKMLNTDVTFNVIKKNDRLISIYPSI